MDKQWCDYVAAVLGLGQAIAVDGTPMTSAPYLGLVADLGHSSLESLRDAALRAGDYHLIYRPGSRGSPVGLCAGLLGLCVLEHPQTRHGGAILVEAQKFRPWFSAVVSHRSPDKPGMPDRSYRGPGGRALSMSRLASFDGLTLTSSHAAEVARRPSPCVKRPRNQAHTGVLSVGRRKSQSVGMTVQTARLGSMSSLSAAGPEDFQVVSVVPVLRMYDVAATIRINVDYLECSLDHQDGDGDRPVYLGVSRDGMEFHLSSHHDDGTPGTAVLVVVRNLDALHAELHKRGYPYFNPGISPGPGNGRQMQDIAPASNRIRFYEPAPAG